LQYAAGFSLYVQSLKLKGEIFSTEQLLWALNLIALNEILILPTAATHCPLEPLPKSAVRSTSMQYLIAGEQVVLPLPTATAHCELALNLEPYNLEP
jgi:hypothetical protein